MANRTPNKVLVVAAHPDDELLGCGATLAKHTRMGDQLEIIIVGEGLTSRIHEKDSVHIRKEVNELAAKAEAAAKFVGAQNISLLGLADNRLDTYPRLDVVRPIEEKIRKYLPSIIYTHHGSDLNIDHRIVNEAVITAARPMPGFSECSLLFFEVPSSTGWQSPDRANCFLPNWYVDVSEDLEKKMKALQIYHTEMRDWPHARSYKAIEHLARWRGASIGVEAAEAFVVGRHLA